MMDLKDIANGVVQYLETLPDGMEISTSEAIEQVYGGEYLPGGDYRIGATILGFNELSTIGALIRRVSARKGISLDCAYDENAPTGLPFNIPFTVHRKHHNKQ